MSIVRAAITGVLFVLATAGTANSQTADAAQAEARDILHQDRRPFGGISIVPARGGPWTVHGFYTVWTGQGQERAAHWVVRRQSGSVAQGTNVTWADSRTCPSVETVFRSIENVPDARPRVPGISEPTELIVTGDGVRHTFWNREARSGNNSATLDMEMSGNVDTPLAQWWSAQSPLLETCWSPQEPST